MYGQAGKNRKWQAVLWCKGTQPSLFTHSLSSDCLLLLLLAPRVGRVVVSRGESCEAHHDTTSIATGLTPFLLGIAPTSNTTSPCRGHVPGVPCQTRTSHSVKPVEMVQPYSFTIVVPAPCLSLSHPPPLHYPCCSSWHAATHVCARDGSCGTTGGVAATYAL